MSFHRNDATELSNELADINNDDTKIELGDRDAVVEHAKKLLKNRGFDKVCLDMLPEAMAVYKETFSLDAAADILVVDTLYWECLPQLFGGKTP